MTASCDQVIKGRFSTFSHHSGRLSITGVLQMVAGWEALTP